MNRKKGKKFAKRSNEKQSIHQRVNVSQVTCALCVSETKVGENFIQCDICNKEFHFRCVNITDIGERDEWMCPNCRRKVSISRSSQENPKETDISLVDLCEQSNNVLEDPDKIVPFEDDTSLATSHRPIKGGRRSIDSDIRSDCRNKPIAIPVSVHRSDVILEDLQENDEDDMSGNMNERVLNQSERQFRNEAENNLIQFRSRDKRQSVDGAAHQFSELGGHQECSTVDERGNRSSQPAGYNERSLTASKVREKVESVLLQSIAREHRTEKSMVDGSAKSSKRSTSSNSSKRESYFRHARDMFDLQELIDDEILRTKLEAIKAKETRAKQLLHQVYRFEDSRDSSSSKGSTKTSKSHVSNWVKDQKNRLESTNERPVQNLTKTIDNPGFDASISMDNTEIENYIQNRTEKISQQPNQDSDLEIGKKKAINQVQYDAKSTKLTEFKIAPTSRSTILPQHRIHDERPILRLDIPPKYAAQPFEIPISCETNVFEKHSTQHVDVMLKDNTNLERHIFTNCDGEEADRINEHFFQKKEPVTLQPNISEDYRDRHPTFLGMNKGTSHSMNHIRTDSYRPIYTSANPMRCSVTSSFNNPTSQNQAANNRTSPAYLVTSRQSILDPHQIAARQTIPKWLPKFDGNPYDWPNFIKRYENTTRLCGFCDDENLERLDRCLEGKAREIVRSQLMMPECVPEIIQILFEKFGRPELVMKATLNSIGNEPNIKYDRLENLSDYGYKVHSACNIIERLGLEYYLYNPELVQEILGKLPHQTRISFAAYCDSIEVVTLRTLANWMRNLSRMINRITPIDAVFPDEKKQHEKNSSIRNQNKNDDNSKPRGGYLNIHDGKNFQLEKKSSCVACDNSCRRLEECTKFKQKDVNQRWDLLKQHSLCRRCLKQHPGNCELSKECGINGCVFKHNSLLHKEKSTYKKKSTSEISKEAESKNENKSPKEDQSIKTGSSNAHFRKDEELFRIALVELHYKGRRCPTYAFLDEGSSFTLMERKLANELNLSGIPETICLLWTKGMHRQEQSEVVNLEISGKSIVNNKMVSTEKYPLNDVHIVEKLDLPEQTLPMEEIKQKYKHLTNIPLVGYEAARPTILIGIKNARIAVPLETIEGDADDPIATRSRLGWQIYGNLKKQSAKGFINVHRVSKCPCQERDEDLHKLIKEHFTIENFGVHANTVSLDSKENEKALKLMKEHTFRKGDRFETRLLWKNDAYSLPDSYPMAMKRLSCLENKGSKVIETINESIQDYIKKGYVSKLSEQEVTATSKRIWYLPVFTVIHPKKPEKLRTVFDAAARVKGISLNSTLFTGPDLSVSIVDILRRFREHRIGVNGDIKEMYHQIVVDEEDRNAQRFIWRNGDKSKKPDVYVMNVLTFGATCSPSLAQFVKNLNATEFQEKYPRAAKAIIKNHYIDDLLDGADSVEEAIQLLKDIKCVHKRGGFEIRNFKSNSSTVLDGIGETNQTEHRKSVDNEKMERILGMFWETKSDCFTFSLKFAKITPDVLNGKRAPTKRELLSLLMSIYDPLGLLSYYLIQLKIILQNVWRAKIKWDDQIPKDLRDDWNRWFQLLPNVERLQIPRWYSTKLSPKNSTKIDLHIFVDASDHAFSALAYLRIEDQNGVDISLVGSKARVTPLKYLSIPRKELLASVLGTRFSQSIRDGLTLKINRRVIWTDSVTVLTWLQSEHTKYSQFVAHRIGEILESTEQCEWRWIPTKQNVADEATKWTKIPSFESTSRWFSGPEFLKLAEEEWPKAQKRITPDGTTEEMKLSCLHSRIILPSIVDINRFSRFERALRAIAYVVRWGNIMLSKIRKSKIPVGPLSQEELSISEKLLFRQAQWEGFPDEMTILTKTLRNPKSPKQIDKGSSIYNCSPYLDEQGLLRVQGRIDNATSLSTNARRPIILPRNHRITSLLMLSQHDKCYHRNHETVINELRQRFYVPRIRVAFRSVRWNCMKCVIKRTRPSPPQMADLPAIRLEPGTRAFTYTGIDYFGPMTVMVGRRPEKRWGVLFTCLTVRAIHIEVAHTMDTQSCIMKIRNFINLRGRPSEIYSDNGTNFKGANNELTVELQKLNVEELGTTFTSCYTKWNFNPPEAPHMGGAWERMIRTVKKCLEESMTSRTPKDEVLQSLLIEIANVVNSRPLTFVPLDVDDDEALTPNHFIFGTSNSLKPPGKFENNGPYLRSAWREIQRCTDKFWKRFINEYVPTLTRRSKWFESVKPLEINDLVIDFDENEPRNTYKRGKIVETIFGSKNQVRRAKVQYSNGNALWRPAVRLGVLDIHPPAPTDNESLDLQKLETGGRIVGAQIQKKIDKSTT